MGNNRNSSIELLRLLLMGGVIILHYVAGGGQLLDNSVKGSGTYYLIVLMNTICVCAVDVFIIISGYYSCLSNKVSFRKVIQLIIQVIIFQLLFTIGIPIVKGDSISLSSVVYNIIPKNYYVTLYVSLMLLTPFLNLFIRKISKNTYKKFLIVITVLFLVEPTLAEVIEGMKGSSIYGISTIGILGAEWGYTIVTFVCLYFIAAYVRKYGSIWSEKQNLMIYFGSLGVLFVWKLAELKNGYSLGAEHYMNPVLIVNALSVFELFRNFTFNSKVVNYMAKGCFTIFILHASLIPHFPIADYGENNIFIFFVRWISNVAVIFMICDGIGICYTTIEKIIFDKIQKKVGFFVMNVEDSD